NTNNSYSGPTTVLAGALHVDNATTSTLSNLSNTVLSGGSLEISVNFTRSIGTTAGTIQLPNGASGFSATTNNSTVNLGGAGATIVWGATGSTFGPTSLALQGTGNRTLTLANGIDLNNTQDVVSVGGGATSPAILSGNIIGAGSASGLTKSGGGYLLLT